MHKVYGTDAFYGMSISFLVSKEAKGSHEVGGKPQRVALHIHSGDVSRQEVIPENGCWYVKETVKQKEPSPQCYPSQQIEW